MTLTIFSRTFAGLILVGAATSAMAQSATRTRLLSLKNPSPAGAPVTLRAEIDGLLGGAPTGRVSFWEGATRFGAKTLAPQIGAGQETLVTPGQHTCALTSAGGLKCWGRNVEGQLGDGRTTWRKVRPIDVVGLTRGVVAVAGNYSHTCAVTAPGGAKCWGQNQYGALGDGTTTFRTTPVDVVGLRGTVVSIASGYLFNCAVTSAGGVACWGWNSIGQLGDGTRTNRRTPVDVTGLTSDVVAVAAGFRHSCALTASGGVKCWGQNRYGQLGDGTRTSRLTPVDVVGLTSGVVAISASGFGHHTCALTASGGVKCWGYNVDGQLGDGTANDRLVPVDVTGLTSGVAAISAGTAESCAVTTAGRAKCWGNNLSGGLGDGTRTGRLTPVDVVGLTSGVVAIAAGPSSCAVTVAASPVAAGGVKCWGWNADGQLGDGTMTNRLTPIDTLNITGIVRARAEFTIPPLTAGLHDLRAFYRSDAGHAPSWASTGQLAQ